MASALRASLRLSSARQVGRFARSGLASLPVRQPSGWLAALPVGSSRNHSGCGDKAGSHGQHVPAGVPVGGQQPRRGNSRAFSSKGGQDGPSKEEFFPDSWVEPEALWDYAESHAHHDEQDHVDDIFTKDFGARNAEWRNEMLRVKPDYFTNLGAGQAPKYLWIGCCDSRVAAENLVQGQPGEIFVHRNIANQVVSTDTNLRAVLHYAVDYLKVEHIIVCGHYDCGGVKAACTDRDHASPLESWLTNIRDVYRLHQKELDAIINDDERHMRLVELNVIEQCLNLYKTGDVQRKRTESVAHGMPHAYPRIHGMVFSPNDGILRRLPVDFKSYLRQYQRVYNMYDAKGMMSSYDTPN